MCPSWRCHMACCCDSCHAPKSTTCCHGYIKKKPKKYIYTLHPPVCRFHGSLPKVPMMHGATPTTVSAATTPATSVPFAATATANQVWPFQWLSFTCSDLEDRARAGSCAGPSAFPTRSAWRRLGRAEAACACVRARVCVYVCVSGDRWGGTGRSCHVRDGRRAWPERRDGRLAGVQALLQKTTPFVGPEKMGCETPNHTVTQDLQHFCFQSQAEIPPQASFPVVFWHVLSWLESGSENTKQPPHTARLDSKNNQKSKKKPNHQPNPKKSGARLWSLKLIYASNVTHPYRNDSGCAVRAVVALP